MTLGAALAPDGNTQTQAANMKTAAVKWADTMRTGTISKNDTWLAYPLPVINLTKEQCDHIMAPILHYILPAIGVCCNFPRYMVFAPQKSLDKEYHIYTMQEIYSIKDMISHTFKNTTAGAMYRTST